MDYKLKRINVDCNLVEIQLFDFASQERFRNIIRNYYKDAHGYLLTYSITDKCSFNNISKWLEEIDKYGEKDACKILVGNKLDDEKYREINKKEGIKLSADLNINFFETSAKTKENVNEMFDFFVREILKKSFGLKIKSNLDLKYSKELKKNYLEIDELKEELERSVLEINKLKEELNKAQKIIESQNLKIKELENISQNNISKDDGKQNDKIIKSLNEQINQKDEELKQLKLKLELSQENKELIPANQMTCVYFTSPDQNIHFPIPCNKNQIFAEIEEKLYKEFPEYRETNNCFIVNGIQVLRFKTVAENHITNSTPVLLLVPK